MPARPVPFRCTGPPARFGHRPIRQACRPVRLSQEEQAQTQTAQQGVGAQYVAVQAIGVVEGVGHGAS